MSSAPISHPWTFPRGFLFGTATSATQIEGSSPDTDWRRFSTEPGRVHNDDTPDPACDSWRRFDDDVRVQRELGLNAYRFSIDWARIEPRPGEFDHSALETYRTLLGALHDAGITPYVTLHHFTLPAWVSERDGLLSPELPERMVRYTRHVVAALGDLCRHWITVNEPNVLAAFAHMMGLWPPAERSPARALRAHHHLLAAHVGMYRAIHHALDRSSGDAQVGVAHHLRVVEPHTRERALDRMGARALARVFNDAFANALCEGKLYGPFDSLVRGPGVFRVADARGTQDFFGVNYYSRDLVRFALRRPDEAFLHRAVTPGAEVSALGWEVYPEGLGRVLDQWGQRSGVPLVVTENGVADSTDTQRPSFLVRHLAEVARVIASGLDVRGYFHWSLLDNFEWAEGYQPRFGLVAVDQATQSRTPRPSAALYARIAREGALSDEVLRAHGTPPADVRRAP